MHAKAALLSKTHAPLEVLTVDLEEPRDDEVLVEIVAAGVGRSDLLARDGEVPVPLPAVLGCEAAGTVLSAGPGAALVTGDHIVVTPHTAKVGLGPIGGGFRPDGTSALSRAGKPIAHGPFGQSLFATNAVVRADDCVRVPADLPWPVLAVLAGEVFAGASAVAHTLRPRPGTSIAIFGMGATGLGSLMAAKLVGCDPIVAVDIKASRLELAEAFGATTTIDPDGQEPVTAIRNMTADGAEFSVDATGLPSVARQAVGCLAQGGTCALAAMAPDAAEIALEMRVLLLGQTLCGSLVARNSLQWLLPRLINFYRRGAFPLDRLVHTYLLDDVNRALEDIVTGAAVKPVLMMR